MSPISKDQQCRVEKMKKVSPEDEIVISGMSGRFPSSNNMKHFEENLMNKVDLVTTDEERWTYTHPEMPQRTGKINNLTKFDASFFGIHYKEAHTMDPASRMLLEHTYEAIIDAGVNPEELRGTRTGVFIGYCISETENFWFYQNFKSEGLAITGCNRGMFAHRISYILGLNGPSYTVDTACSSSLYAMEHAYRSIQDGLCDAALVGAGNLCLHPFVSLEFSKLGVLSRDGSCKSFDEAANGYVRSEAAAMVYLQKAKDAKRIYATVVHAKVNCDGFKKQGITFPSSKLQGELLQNFYEEIGISPSSLDYIEAHGTGTKVGDPEEINAIDRVFCTGRNEPLPIGSIKSNVGHSEGASGLCSLAKVLIAMESGFIPPNMNLKNLRKEIKALGEGRLKVVTDPMPWNGGLVGINSFGFGGANAHILLRSNSKEKINGGQPNDNLPRLVAVSGRTSEAVNVLLSDLESRLVDVEYIKLLHDIHSKNIKGHFYRGYTILPARGLVKNKIREIDNYSGIKRPVCFVFYGIGSQWSAIGESLLHLPVFFERIKKCDTVLKPYGVSIVEILTNKNKNTFNNILNAFVGTAALQIGLVDVLRSINIEPDIIIGHSTGEFGCAYADGCLTAEQIILSAYFYGLSLVETKAHVRGSMANIGLGYAKLQSMCPSDIEIACHNAVDNVTISGPAESIKAFVAKLQAQNISATEIPCDNIPYHSHYIAPAGQKLLAYLQKVIPSANLRSQKWLSTSVPVKKWDTSVAKLCSAEYYTNNLISPVLFEEASALIPKNAIAIEITPHGFLQTIFHQSLSSTTTNITLTEQSCKNNVEVLLQGIGKMYNAGLQPQLDKLYPAVQYPVSRTTPMISHLIKWDHSVDWFVPWFKNEKITTGERNVTISLENENFAFISGHVIDGRTLFPATGYLTLVWETFSMMLGELHTEISVVFENVKFLRATTITNDRPVKFTLIIQKGSGKFEVVEGGAAVVTGYIRITNNPANERTDISLLDPSIEEEEEMMTRDVYKELRLRGYNYTGEFRCIKSSTINGSKGHVIWNDNWVSFMDNLLQMKILGTDTRGLFVPTGIMKLVIDARSHLKQIRDMPENDINFPVYVNPKLDVIVSGGVEIRGLRASAIPRRKPAGEPVLEEYKFVPYTDRAEVSLRDIVRLSTHICLENHLEIKVKAIELLEEADSVPSSNVLSPLISEALGDIPLIQADISIAGNNITFEDDFLPANININDVQKISSDSNILLSVGHKLLAPDRAENLKVLLAATKKDGFLLSREDCQIKNSSELAEKNGLDVILEKKVEKELFVLLKKRDKTFKKSFVIKISNDKFDWVEEMRKTMNEILEKETPNTTRLIFVSEGDFKNGLIGFINCLRREPGGEIVRGLLIQDPKAPKFSLENPLYAKELQKDLACLVLRENGVWGNYRHLPLKPLGLKPVRHIVANQAVRGDLNSLTWFEGPIQVGYDNDDLIKVVYASINFKDIMLATGKLAVEVVEKDRLKQENVLGFEYCGINKKGERIMGLVERQTMSNLLVCDRILNWKIPESWSFEDASTVPSTYGTCYYAFYVIYKLKKTDKVLIHAGSGGVGQAAINLALHEGCEVFTTVGTPEKRRFILEHFPQIKESHIGNSRDTSFEQMIVTQTNGRGVDVVLNSLAEEKLQASVRCLATGGHFLEIGKFDLAANNRLGMECFVRNISYHGVMLDTVFNDTDERKQRVRDVFASGLSKGAIKPLVRTVFPKEQIEDAFRYMAAGKHIGKVVIKVRDPKEQSDSLEMAVPHYHCIENRSYIILGGLGGFGLELADWLVLRGAKNLVITSRTGLRNGYQKLRVKLWQSYGTKVIIVAGKDASKRNECQAIIEEALKLAPVDGIFNLAVVLKDAIWSNQTAESFEESFRAKAWSTKHLDDLTRKLCPDLRHFVVFSSVSCGRGNAGQTNYGMSNSVMERICESRVAEGLPGLAIQWGAIGDVGLVADMQEDNKEVIIGGTLQQKISSCLQKLDHFMRQDSPVVSSIVVAEKKIGSGATLNAVDAVLNIMDLKDLKSVSMQTSLSELGMDSMMAVEIKQTLEREFEIFLTAQDIRSLNFAKLQEMSVNNPKDTNGGEKS